MDHCYQALISHLISDGGLGVQISLTEFFEVNFFCFSGQTFNLKFAKNKMLRKQNDEKTKTKKTLLTSRYKAWAYLCSKALLVG